MGPTASMLEPKHEPSQAATQSMDSDSRVLFQCYARFCLDVAESDQYHFADGGRGIIFDSAAAALSWLWSSPDASDMEVEAKHAELIGIVNPIMDGITDTPAEKKAEKKKNNTKKQMKGKAVVARDTEARSVNRSRDDTSCKKYCSVDEVFPCVTYAAAPEGLLGDCARSSKYGEDGEREMSNMTTGVPDGSLGLDSVPKLNDDANFFLPGTSPQDERMIDEDFQEMSDKDLPDRYALMDGLARVCEKTQQLLDGMDGDDMGKVMLALKATGHWMDMNPDSTEAELMQTRSDFEEAVTPSLRNQGLPELRETLSDLESHYSDEDGSIAEPPFEHDPEINEILI